MQGSNAFYKFTQTEQNEIVILTYNIPGLLIDITLLALLTLTAVFPDRLVTCDFSIRILRRVLVWLAFLYISLG